MLKRFASAVLIIALLGTLGGFSAFAQSATEPDVQSSKTQPPLASETATAGQPNERLKADIDRLVADAKAGKVVPAERPQLQPARSNNLSKGKKIAIGVAVAIAVVTVVLIVNKPRVTGAAFQ